MHRPKVQIIIPVYNAGPYLRRCLESVQAQTFTDWQAIVIDDASTDGSYAVLCEFASMDSRFVCMRQPENGGVAAARNTALQHLCCEYTAFLDADDYWEPDMLAVMLEKAEAGQCDIVQCRFIYDFPGGGQLLPRGAFAKDTVLCGKALKQVYRKMMTGINMNHVCMKLIRTQCMAGLSFDTALQTAEDLQFCIALFQQVKRYCFINAVLYHYRRSAQSLTGRGLPLREKLRANRRIAKSMVLALPAWDMDTSFYEILSHMRPYLLILLKILRMIQERMMSGSQAGERPKRRSGL